MTAGMKIDGETDFDATPETIYQSFSRVCVCVYIFLKCACDLFFSQICCFLIF